MTGLPRIVLAILPLVLGAGLARADGLTVHPSAVALKGKDARQRVVVTQTTAGRDVDRSREARFTSETPAIMQVSANGVLTPVADGQGTLAISVGGQSVRVPVTVTGTASPSPVTFERDIEPILTRFGCNAGACHGKARGQNGFALSLLGFNPNFDFEAITQEARGRRVFPASPDASLILRKPSGQVPHGGGVKLPTDDPHFEKLRRWIVAGTPRTPTSAARVERVTVYPTQRLLAPRSAQQLVVTAHYSDGSAEDVTHLAAFQSNDAGFAAVDSHGLVTAGPIPGEAAIMARYMNQFAVSTVIVPLPGSVPDAVYAELPRKNFIDGHVWDKLKSLGVTPSAPAADATYHRRTYLDVIGRLPTPDETRAFLADADPKKREKLIDRLLERPEYADFWANKWADLLRPNPYRVGIKAVFNLDAWLRESFRANKPYDQFVRELLTATGSTFRNGAVVLFRDRREPDEITTIVSQIVLGVRLDCARCHHHPFEVWGQDDFYSFAAFFARIGHKGTGLSPPISGSEEGFYAAAKGEVKHPLDGRVLAPTPLLGRPLTLPADCDPRTALADWVTAPENPFFAKAIVNRVWAELMGRGIVDPVDDLRATNPPSNGPLLDALAADFRSNGYDLKKLIRRIATSHVYGLSSIPSDRNAGDGRNFSRHYRQRLRAEVLLDAVSDVTGVREKFEAMPPGSRSLALWTVRSQSVFLDSFGRPDPNQDPPCERTGDTTVVQALHLMNAPGLQEKVTADAGRAAKLAAGKQSIDRMIEELYLLTYCRLPTDDERAACLRRFDRPGVTRRQAVEDLMWALLNTPEFVFED
jgi:hypothetical protein